MRRSEGTSSVAFWGINNQLPNRFLQLFNVRYKFVHCRLLNVRSEFVYVPLFNVKCLFPKIISFAGRRQRLLIDARPKFGVLNSPRKMMTCYLRDTNKFLRCHTLCTSILKCEFPRKGIKLTRFVLFEVLGVPQPWGTSV